MNRNLRTETKIGLLLLCIFNVMNFIYHETGSEILGLHFLLGGFAGLAFAEIIIGLLPEKTYHKLKDLKRGFIKTIK